MTKKFGPRDEGDSHASHLHLSTPSFPKNSRDTIRRVATRSLVKRLEQWEWYSFPEYAGVNAAEKESRCGLAIDHVRLPADEKARI